MTHDAWSIVVVIGVTGWIVSIIMMLLKAFPRRDEFISSQGMRWGSVGLVSFVIWIVGMLNA